MVKIPNLAIFSNYAQLKKKPLALEEVALVNVEKKKCGYLWLI